MYWFDFKTLKNAYLVAPSLQNYFNKEFHGLFLVFDVSGPVGILERVQGLHKIPVKISRASTHIQKALRWGDILHGIEGNIVHAQEARNL
jgi:hypothetical protein